MKRMRWMPAVVAMLAVTACTRSPVNLEERMETARTGPEMIADWIIEGRNDFLLVDLRPDVQYGAAHIRGAVHLSPQDLQDDQVVRSLPDYKKIVFYDEDGSLDAGTLRPAFEQGLRVMVLRGGYAAWEDEVLEPPQTVATQQERKAVAVARYFKGESALGTPQPLEEVRAEEYLQSEEELPALDLESEQPYELEGC